MASYKVTKKFYHSQEGRFYKPGEMVSDVKFPKDDKGKAILPIKSLDIPEPAKPSKKPKESIPKEPPQEKPITGDE